MRLSLLMRDFSVSLLVLSALLLTWSGYAEATSAPVVTALFANFSSGRINGGFTVADESGQVTGLRVRIDNGVGAAGSSCLVPVGTASGAIQSTGQKSFTINAAGTCGPSFNNRINRCYRAQVEATSTAIPPMKGSSNYAIFGRRGCGPGSNPVLAAGQSHSLLLKGDGTVVGWGANYSGQTAIPLNLSRVVAIAAGGDHSLALKYDGTVIAWGDSFATVPVDLSNVVGIAAGYYHSVALKADGTVVAWGDNYNGETTVPAGLSDVVAIAAGNYHSLALKFDGTVVAWGQASPPADLSDVVAIAAGAYHSMALKADGTVIAWGDNSTGQAGVPAGLSDVVAIAAGDYHSLALKSDGTVVAWGYNYFEQATVPAGLAGVVAIATGQYHSLALKADGTAVAWGKNYYAESTVPTDLSGVIAVATGEFYSVALKVNGTVIAWGDNFNGQATVPAYLSDVVAVATGSFESLALLSGGTVVAWGGRDFRYPWSSGAPVPPGLSDVIAIAVGDHHSLALKADGTVIAWEDYGWGSEQSIGAAGLSGVVAISAGLTHSLALKSDGTVVAWGSNDWGETNVPAGLTGVVAISAGYYYSLALTSDGSIITWGYNDLYQANVPVWLPGLSGVIAVAAGSYHALAVKADGTVIAWGDNGYGQATVPPGLTGVIAVAAGYSNSLALKSDGTVVSWGYISAKGEKAIPVSLPAISLLTPAAGEPVVNGESFAVRWTAANYDSRTTISLFRDTDSQGYDGSLIAAGIKPDAPGGSYTWNISALAEGSSWVYAKIVNGTNVAYDYSPGPLVVSSRHPVTTVQPAGGTFATPQTVTLSTNRSATIYYTTDGSTPNQSSSVYSGPLVVTTTTTIRFFNVDDTGYVEQVQSATYVIDMVPPTIMIISPLAGFVTSTTPTIVYTVSDGVVITKLDGSVISTPSGSALGPLSQGTHTLRIEATDSVGNAGFREVVFTVDTIPPTWTVDNQAPVSNSPSLTIRGSREEGSTLLVSVNTSAIVGTVSYPTASTWSVDITNLAKDGNLFSLSLTDAAGNRSSRGRIIRYNLPPTSTTASIITADNTPSTPVVPTIIDPNTGDLFTVSITAQPTHGVAVVAEGNKLVYTPEAGYYGADRFSYTVTDQGGLSVSGSALVVINVSPPLPVSGAAATASADRTVRLTWVPSVSTDTATYRIYSNNGNGRVSYATPFAIVAHPGRELITAPVPEGDYIFVIRAVDTSGLVETNSNSFFARVDVTPPLPLSNVTAKPLTGNRVQISWAASPATDVKNYHVYGDNGSGTIEYATPIASLNSATYLLTTDALTAGGTYRYAVLAEDGNGNRSSPVVSAPVTLSYPDLVVSSVSWSPVTFFFGDTVTFTVRIANIGSAPTSGQGFFTGFALDNTVVFQKYYSGQIPVGGSADITVTQRMLYTAKSYQITVTADCLASQVEADTTNNSLSKPFIITADYLVALVADKPAYSAGSTVNVTSMVANSSAPSSFFSDSDLTVTCTLSDAANAQVIAPVTMTYASGDKSFRTAMQLPANLPNGTYRLVVTVIGKSSGVTKSATQDISVVEGVLLTIGSSTAKYYPNEKIVLSGTLHTARGKAIANQSITLALNVNGMSQSMNAITDANGTYTYTYSIPKGIGGAFSVTATTYANQLVNSAITTFTVEGLFISPTGINIPDMVKNNPASVVNQIKLINIGTEPVTGIAVTLTDANPTDSVMAQLVNAGLPTTLPPGGSVAIDLLLTAGLDAPSSAAFTLSATADTLPTPSLPVIPVTVSLVDPSPVPEVSPNTFTVGVQPGGTVVRQITFKNGGYGVLHNVVVQPPNLSWGSVVGGNIGTLKPGEVRTFDLVFSPPTDESLVPLGNYNVPLTIMSTEIVIPLINATVQVVSLGQGNIDIKVGDDIGLRVQGAKVTLISQQDYAFGSQMAKNILMSTTDATGTAHFTSVDVGEYDFQVDADHHDTVKGHLTINPGDNIPGKIVNMVASVVNVEWSVTPTSITDQYAIDLTMTLNATIHAQPKPFIYLNPNFIEFSLNPGEEYAGEIRIVNPTDSTITDITVDSFPLRQQGISMSFQTPDGAIITEIPPKSELRLPFNARLLPHASTATHDVGIITAAGSYIYIDAFTGQPAKGSVSAFTSVKFKEVPVPGKLLSIATSPSAILITEYCSGWVTNSLSNGFAVTTQTIKVTNTSAEPISLGDAYGVTSKISLLNELMDIYGVGLIAKGWNFLNKGQIPGVGSLWKGNFTSHLLAPNESTYLTLEQMDPTTLGVSLPDVGLKFGAVFFGYGNGANSIPEYKIIPIAVVQICTNGISVPVMHTEPPTTNNNITGLLDGWTASITPESGIALPTGFQNYNIPSVPPSSTEQATVTLKLSQKAALEREVFKASLDMTALVAAMNNVKVDILIRDKDNLVLKNELFNPVVTATKGISSLNGDGTIPQSKEASAEWAILPLPTAGGDVPEGTGYQVGARISFTVNGVNKSYDTAFVPITVLPEPSLVLDYYVKSAVDAAEPFQITAKVTNNGKGSARNFRIASAQPVIMENKTGRQASFEIIGAGLESEFNDGKTEIVFGDIPPGGVISGSWTMTSSLRGDFTDFKAQLTHESPQGLPLTDIITRVNTHIIPSLHRYAVIDPRMVDPQSMVSDPVDASSGAHLLERTLLTVNGVRPIDFTLSYNSLLTGADFAGNGWGHNHQVRVLPVEDGTLAVRWTGNRSNSFYRSGVNLYSSADTATRFDILARNVDASFTLIRKDGSVFAFDASGRLNRQHNRTGQALSYSYDDAGRLSTITEPVSGKTLGVSYNQAGLIDIVSDPLNRQVKLAYDEYRNLTGITDPENRNFSYTYTTGGKVLTGLDGEGNTIFINTYDSDGRVAAQDDALVTTTLLTTFDYDDRLATEGLFITTVTNRAGDTRILTHDRKFNLVRIEDELQHVTAFTYDDAGNRLSSTDSNDNVTAYTYDARGNLKTVTDPKNRVTTMEYDGNDNLLSATDNAGRKTTTIYDDHNRVLSITDPLDNTTRYTYNVDGQVETVRDAKGGVSTFTYAGGLLESMSDTAGTAILYAYDMAGRITGITDTARKTTIMEYDGSDNLTRTTDPLGHSWSYTDDSRHNRLTATDPKGYTTTSVYNGNGKLTSMTNPLNQITTFDYDPEDRLTKVTDSRGNSVVTAYDAASRPISVTDQLGNSITTSYDSVGNVIAQKDAYNTTVMTSSYDQKTYQPLTIKDALLNIVTYGYDSLDRVVSVLDPLGRNRQQNYDGRNRLISVTDAKNGISCQSYDANGNWVKLKDPNGNITTFEYNAANWLSSTTTSAGKKSILSYADGRLSSVTNARNQTATYTYYDDGRVKSTTDSSGIITYAYDASGNVLTVNEGGKTLSFAYDALNRVTSHTNGDGNAIRYAYDEVGNLIVLTYPDGKTVTYGYDASNRLFTVTDWANRVTSYIYDKNGRLSSTTRPDGSVETRLYDAAGQMTQLKDATGDGKIINRYDFTYDAAGNVTTEEGTGAEVEYTLPADAMTYVADNRLATHNGSTVSYDADGNMTIGPLDGAIQTFTYDSRNRLTGVAGTAYSYDAINNRTAVTTAGGTTNYVVNPETALSQVLMEKDGSGAINAWYVYGLGLIGRQNAGSGFSVYHYDRRGSTVALTDAAGAVTDTYSYGPYGEILNHSGATAQPFQYNGRDGVKADGNGLYHMRTRYYSITLRRFINSDILLGSVSDGQTLHRYAYVSSNPIMYIDPLGRARDFLDNMTTVFNNPALLAEGELVELLKRFYANRAFANGKINTTKWGLSWGKLMKGGKVSYGQSAVNLKIFGDLLDTLSNGITAENEAIVTGNNINSIVYSSQDTTTKFAKSFAELSGFGLRSITKIFTSVGTGTADIIGFVNDNTIKYDKASQAVNHVSGFINGMNNAADTYYSGKKIYSFLGGQ